MKFMFETFEEYATIMEIDSKHPSWEAFKMIWNMARTPAMTCDENGKLVLDSAASNPDDYLQDKEWRNRYGGK
jgi:hypothetical protein